MQQPVNLCEITSADIHAQQYGMKKGEFVQFAAEAFKMAESRYKNIGGLNTSTNKNIGQDGANKNESTNVNVSCEFRLFFNDNNRGGTPEPLEEHNKIHFEFTS